MRTQILRIRITDAQLNELRVAAAGHSGTVAEYARSLLFPDVASIGHSVPAAPVPAWPQSATALTAEELALDERFNSLARPEPAPTVNEDETGSYWPEDQDYQE